MPSICTLTAGALQIIMQGGNVTNPIVQVLGSKKMNTLKPNSDRYRILLSDGQYSITNAMLTITTDDKLGSNGLQTFSVLKLTKYLTTVATNTGKSEARVLLIMNMELLRNGNNIGEIIGSPTPLSMTELLKPSTSGHTYGTSSDTDSTRSNENESTSNYNTPRGSGVPMGNCTCSLHSQDVQPISSRSPNQNTVVTRQQQIASNCTLTEGALQIIMNRGNVTDPVVQVLGSKKMNTLNANSDRYRLLLSDGQYSITNAILTTTTNNKWGSIGSQMFSVLKLTKYLTTQSINPGNTEALVLLIMNMEILVDGNMIGAKIGLPTPLSMTDLQKPSTNSHTNGTSSNGTSNSGTQGSSGVPLENGTGSLHSQVVRPISSPSP